MAGVEQFLARRLKLKINAAKSAVDLPSRRKFLGFSFTPGRMPRRRIAPRALARFNMDRARSGMVPALPSRPRKTMRPVASPFSLSSARVIHSA
jgi:hypothetical protein